MRMLAAAIAFTATSALVSAQAPKPLTIYVADVEGGNATLFVLPSGETVLIDAGSGGAAGARDAERIMAAVKASGAGAIDHLIVTHWHSDHYGGIAELSKRIAIKHFVDHGPNTEPSQTAADEFIAKVYPDLLAKAMHTVAKAGDRLNVPGVDWRIVMASGHAQKTALPGAGRPNPACAAFQPKDADPTENAQSVGSVVTFGKFKLVHLGDLTWQKEFELMCPTNPIGTVDLFVVSHHGQNISNAPVLVHGLQPRVAVMNNGTRKGGQPETMKTLFSSPGLEAVWQSHFSLLSGQEYTVPGMFIANTVDDRPAAIPIEPATTTQGPPPVHNGTSYWIKITAQADGTFEVTNARNGFSKIYKARP